jgi:hypothetical protein
MHSVNPAASGAGVVDMNATIKDMTENLVEEEPVDNQQTLNQDDQVEAFPNLATIGTAEHLDDLTALDPQAVMTPESLLVDPLNDTLPLAIFPDEAELPLSKQEVTPVDTEVPSAESGLPRDSSHHPQMPMQSPNPGSNSL